VVDAADRMVSASALSLAKAVPDLRYMS